LAREAVVTSPAAEILCGMQRGLPVRELRTHRNGKRANGISVLTLASTAHCVIGFENRTGDSYAPVFAFYLFIPVAGSHSPASSSPAFPRWDTAWEREGNGWASRHTLMRSLNDKMKMSPMMFLRCLTLKDPFRGSMDAMGGSGPGVDSARSVVRMEWNLG